jgi:hypothetical protein
MNSDGLVQPSESGDFHPRDTHAFATGTNSQLLLPPSVSPGTFPASPRIERRFIVGDITSESKSLMKMLFFSSDRSEVQMASTRFTTAGIPCEVRNTPLLQQEPEERSASELWIRNDRDCHRALMMCVQLGIGFSRRPKPLFEPDLDLEPAESVTEEME